MSVYSESFNPLSAPIDKGWFIEHMQTLIWGYRNSNCQINISVMFQHPGSVDQISDGRPSTFAAMLKLIALIS